VTSSSRIAVALLAVAALAGPAGAEDPPGFPSSPSSPSSPAAPSGPSALEAFAGERMAAISKFARDKEEDPRFAEREEKSGKCRIDRERAVLMLTFNADGTLHCKAPVLAESYAIEVHILTVKSLFATGNHYRVTAKPGRALPAVSVHGAAADVKAAITAMSGLREDYSEAAWWQAPRLFGPFHNEDVTLTVSLDEAGVKQDTALTITPLSAVNLSVLAALSPGVTTYVVADGAVKAQRNDRELDYFFGVHLYPLSWARIAKGRLRPGRYFVPEYVSFADRLSLTAGVDLARPRESAYLGLSFEVYSGIALTAGWQPRKVPRLTDGISEGQSIEGDTVPERSAWDLRRWAVGLSLDASLLKPLIGYLAR